MNKATPIPAAPLSKFDQIKLKYPDAKEYYKKNQAYVKPDIARIETYGADIPAKLLFDRDIPSTTGVTQQFIFSQEALKDG